MPICAAAYNQKATYWGAPVQSGFGGFTFSSPVVINCRWEDKTELFTDHAGVERTSSAIVWTFDRLEDNGYLYHGETSETDPTSLDDAFEIKRSDEIPDLRGLNFERKAYL